MMGEHGPISPPRWLSALFLAILLGLIAAYASGVLPLVHYPTCKERGGQWIDGLTKQQLPRCHIPAERSSND
jgi:hypothetical protein